MFPGLTPLRARFFSRIKCMTNYTAYVFLHCICTSPPLTSSPPHHGPYPKFCAPGPAAARSPCPCAPSPVSPLVESSV